MKSTIFAVALCAPFFASAADISISCIGPDSDDCPITVTAKLQGEQLIASFSTGLKNASGEVQRGQLSYCYGSSGPFNPDGWYANRQCSISGTEKVLNGELTKRQLAESQVTFEVRKIYTSCSMTADTVFLKPVCKSY